MTQRWWHKFTGGRPMTFVRHAFIDNVIDRDVNCYIDAFGRRWLAHHKWSNFRVESEHPFDIWEE